MNFCFKIYFTVCLSASRLLAALSLAQNSGVGRETAHALAQLMAQPASAVGLRTLDLAQVRTDTGGSAC